MDLLILEEPRVQLFRSMIIDEVPENLPGLVDVDEFTTFKTDKRRLEHVSGRRLLAESLLEWGIDHSQIRVIRDENRTPLLKWLDGSFQNSPLPSFSTCHSGGMVHLILCEPGWWVGVDAERTDRGIAANAFDQFTKGEELESLRRKPEEAIRLWTAKEAIQKAMHLGMALNPRDVIIPDSESTLDINGVEVHLRGFRLDGMQIHIAWRWAGSEPRTAEDNLLDKARSNLRDADGRLAFDVGCSTMRGA